MSDPMLEKIIQTIYEFEGRLSALEGRLGVVEKDTVGLQTYGPLPRRPSPVVDQEVVDRLVSKLRGTGQPSFPPVPFPRPAGAGPVDWTHDPVSTLMEIERVLIDALGGAPDDLLFTDPRQLSITTDMRPFMRALGGKWNGVLDRVAEKRTAMDGRPAGALVGDQEEGSLLGAVKQRSDRPVSDKDGHA